MYYISESIKSQTVWSLLQSSSVKTSLISFAESIEFEISGHSKIQTVYDANTGKSNIIN